MEFRLDERADGSVVIVRIAPVVIGTFADRAIAEKVLSFLVEDALDEAAEELETVTGDSAPKLPAPTEPVQAPSKVPAAPRVPAILVKDESSEDADEGSDDVWCDRELEQAFERISNGEKLTKVARDFKKSWTVLRGKWAQHRKARTREEDNHERVQCSLCDRSFVPTPGNMELCARCRD